MACGSKGSEGPLLYELQSNQDSSAQKAAEEPEDTASRWKVKRKGHLSQRCTVSWLILMRVKWIQLEDGEFQKVCCVLATSQFFEKSTQLFWRADWPSPSPKACKQELGHRVWHEGAWLEIGSEGAQKNQNQFSLRNTRNTIKVIHIYTIKHCLRLCLSF